MKITQYKAIQENTRVALVFDVETNGLINSKKANQPLETFPYVLQISYAMYDLTNNCLVKTVDSYIKVPDHVVISPETTNINGISKDLCLSKGVPICEVLCEFYADYHQSDILVAHNFKFDAMFIDAEFNRNWDTLRLICPYSLNLFHQTYMTQLGIQYKCTMADSTDICKLPSKRKPFPGKEATFKWPTLTELHNFLFQEIPRGMHNSMMDVLVTLRCFVMLESGLKLEQEQMKEIEQNVFA